MYCCLVVGTDTKFFHYVQTSSGKVEFHPNGSLVIKKVEQADEGHYRYYYNAFHNCSHENMILSRLFFWILLNLLFGPILASFASHLKLHTALERPYFREQSMTPLRTGQCTGVCPIYWVMLIIAGVKCRMEWENLAKPFISMYKVRRGEGQKKGNVIFQHKPNIRQHQKLSF